MNFEPHSRRVLYRASERVYMSQVWPFIGMGEVRGRTHRTCLNTPLECQWMDVLAMSRTSVANRICLAGCVLRPASWIRFLYTTVRGHACVSYAVSFGPGTVPGCCDVVIRSRSQFQRRDPSGRIRFARVGSTTQTTQPHLDQPLCRWDISHPFYNR